MLCYKGPHLQGWFLFIPFQEVKMIITKSNDLWALKRFLSKINKLNHVWKLNFINFEVGINAHTLNFFVYHIQCWKLQI